MKCLWRVMMIGCLFLSACGQEAAVPDKAAPPLGASPSVTLGAVADAGEANAVPIQSSKADLSPDNTKIEFIGTHVGEKPDPRTGGFTKFTGKAELDAAGKSLQSVSADIETASLWTEFEKLTNHLNSPDFFDTREHPTARFVSSKINPESGENQVRITGNLTLLGNTKEISFPATVSISGDGLALKANFTIDRTEFGMDKLQDRVEKIVTLNVVIGEKTQPKTGGGKRPGGAARKK